MIGNEDFAAKDKIEGFEDLREEGRTNRLANHVLVFMMQGIRKKYKQPLAHYFVQGTISTEKLTVLLKNVIRKVIEQGLMIAVAEDFVNIDFRLIIVKFVNL